MTATTEHPAAASSKAKGQLSPVRISAKLIHEAVEASAKQHRSIANQVEHWAWLGKMFEEMPSVSAKDVAAVASGHFNIEDFAESIRVRDALLGKLDVSMLSESEEEVYDDLIALMPPSKVSKAFYARMVEKGGAVGLNDQGQMVRLAPGGAEQGITSP